MKKILSYALVAITIIFAASGCTSAPESETSKDGLGAVSLKIRTDNTVSVSDGTRASVAPENYIVKIYSTDGLIYLFEGLDEVPDKLWLKCGDYTVKVKAGDSSLLASGPYYEGESNFKISVGPATTVPVTCYIASTLLTVNFDSSIENNFSSYGVIVAVNDTTEISFDASNKGTIRYIKLPAAQNSIGWTFDGKTNGGKTFHKTGVISPVKPRTEYRLNYRYVDSDKGDVTLSIDVDETTEDIDNEIDIFQRPEIVPLGFDIAQTQIFDGSSDYVFSITSSSEISSVLLSHSTLGQGLEVVGNPDAASAGILFEQKEEGKAKLTVGAAMIANLPGGLNTITITVKDSQNKTQTAILKISVSGINEIADADIWTDKVSVSVVIPGTSAANVQFGYRLASSEGEWTRVSTEKAEEQNTYTATIGGLSSDTQYEFVALLDGAQYGTSTLATTEQARQLPNGGFEEWYQNTAWYPYSENGSAFWGTGNPMSTMMGASYNITTPENDPRPGSKGTKSAKLDSKFVGFGSLGKIAAGNMFTGESKGMSTGTNGIVAFGRPWNSRPKALKGWYKATVGTIDYTGNDSPAAKGDPDVYQIFVCLTDWDEPHNVDTADKGTFFNPATDSGIIAYGEIRSSEQVAEWTDFRIELEYRSLTRKPKYIVVVATASAYGDYFTGSTGSVMYIDDFELEY